MPPAASPPSASTVAVDLRALVPEATGIGVYTRELLAALAARGDGLRYLAMAHKEPRGAAGLPGLTGLPGPTGLPGLDGQAPGAAAGAGGAAASAIGLEVHPAPLGVLWQQLTLPRRLRRGDVDLLFSPLQTLPLRCPVPAVVTLMDLTVLLYPEAHRLKVRWSQVPFLERSLEAARRVITLSRATADDLAFHFPRVRRKVRVVPPGVAPAFRPATEEEVARIREELGAPQGYVLYVGTLEPRKNLGTLLTAWEMLAADDPDFPPLVVAGGYGWHSRRLLRRLEALRSLGLRHLGRVDGARLVELYQGARVFAFPSLYEGFGLPLLEAMACGVPCVTSDVSSLPEVLGDAGIAVNPREPREVAAALLKLVADPARAADLGRRGRARAAGFTWPRAAAQTAKVFREALADPAPEADAGRRVGVD